MTALVFALLIQIWMSAATAGLALGCCRGSATIAEALLAASCFDDHGTDQPGVTGTEARLNAGFGMGGPHAADAATCASCAGNCGGTASPVVHARPTGSPVIAASFVPTPLQVTAHLPPAPHRLDRPPSGNRR